MSAERVKLIGTVFVNYCPACEVKFVVHYVDELKELVPQVVDICPYCGAFIGQEKEDGKVQEAD